MLDWTDAETASALQELARVVESGRGLAFWIGAGASSWCEYPRWAKLADMVHGEFTKCEAGYDKDRALAAKSVGDYPELFEVCCEASRQRFLRIVAEQFAPREPTPVYERFLKNLSTLRPIAVLTTNIDELLEKNLGTATTLQATDIERALSLFNKEQEFVLKVHGSVSDLDSIVMTTSDYQRLQTSDVPAQLSRLLGSASVVFVGYGMGDEHLLRVLAENVELNKLLGDGPHFLVTERAIEGLPASVRQIRFKAIPHEDHRAALQVLEEIVRLKAGASDDGGSSSQRRVPSQPQAAFQQARSGDERAPEGASRGHVKPRKAAELLSAHLLFDPLPPGTWETSQTATATREDGSEIEMVAGTGFTNEEFSRPESSAAHDLIAGALCFDTVFAPLSALPRLLALAGTEMLLRLVEVGVVQFIWWETRSGIAFPKGQIAGGDLMRFAVLNPDKTERTVEQALKDSGVESGHAESILERTRIISDEEEGVVENAVRGLLLQPSIRAILGVSGGTPIDSLAHWHMFPVLRLASVVKLGTACRLLGLPSVKLDFGMAELAGPALAAATVAEYTVDDVAGYAVRGSFAADLGAGATGDLLEAVLAFRDTEAGVQVRREIAPLLKIDAGGDVSVAINGALRAALPPTTLEMAKDQCTQLHTPTPGQGAARPAFWNDKRCVEGAARAWRKVSLRRLKAFCRERKLEQYDQCPCGSGEKLRFCCMAALADRHS